jgi:hypothetical protein
MTTGSSKAGLLSASGPDHAHPTRDMVGEGAPAGQRSFGSERGPSRSDNGPFGNQRGFRGERGMVTAELAVATLAALALLVMLCWGIFLVVMQLRCIDLAAAVARQTARGDVAAVRQAERDAPAGSQITATQGTHLVVIEIRVTARPFADWLVPVPLKATAQVVPEPGKSGH